MSKNTSTEYWRHVHVIAEEIYQEAKNDPDIDVDDRIHENVDGSYWVIYTNAAVDTLRFSDNESELFEAGADMSHCKSYSDTVCSLAFYAMRADVQCRLETLREE